MKNLYSDNNADSTTVPHVHYLRVLLSFILFSIFISPVHAQNFRSAAQAGAGNNVTSIKINKPSGTVTGDVMIAAISTRPYNVNIQAPAGWNLINEEQNPKGNGDNVQAIYWKAAGPADAATTSYTWTFNKSEGSAGGILTFYNINTADPIDVYDGQTSGSNLTFSTPTVTTSGPGEMLVACHCFGSCGSWTTPAGMSQPVDVASNPVPYELGESMCMSYALQAAAGATGNKTATASAYAEVGISQILALNPNTTISYVASPYCSTEGTATITRKGTIGGVYSSSSANLSLNTATGAVNLAASKPGTYTVTYKYGAGYTSSVSTSITIYGAATVSGVPTPTCLGGSTGTITASGTGGNTPYSYSLNNGAYQSSSLFTGLAAGTYTINIKTANGCVSSTSVTVSPYPYSTDDQTATGTDSWIGHIYDSKTFTNYFGHFTEPETFVENYDGPTTCFNVVSNSVTQSIYTEDFAVRYLMKSSKEGLYIADLSSDDGSRLTVDGTLVYNNWTDHSSVITPRVLMNLTGSSALKYEYYEGTGDNQVQFQNLTLVLANNLSTNITQTACLGGAGLTISGDAFGALPSGITLSGTGYQWSYSKTPGGARTNIAGATSATFIPSTSAAPFNVAGTYYIYRSAIVSSANNTGVNPYVATNVSNAATLTVTAPPSATIQYSGGPYCSAGTAMVTRTGTAGGVFSAPGGLSINSSTGSIDLAASAKGTYTVTYTIAATSTCQAYTATASVQVAPIANNQLDFVNGAHGVVCSTTAENGSATLTAPSGTVFVNVSFASFGSPAGSCSAFTQGSCHAATSQSVSEGYLLGKNTATIPATNAVFGDPCSGTAKKLFVQAIYTQPVCSGSLPGTITATVPTGGSGTYTYLWEKSTTSSSTGFAAAPGTNNAKDYTPGAVTQTTWYRRTVVSAGCSDVSDVIQISVSALPTATISYAGTPYCSSAGSATVTLTGIPGGTYSSSSGLIIDAATGTVNVGASTAGSYTVSYVVATQCGTYTATTGITITTQPYVTGNYPGNPYCTNYGIAYPNGAKAGADGTISSPPGLSINSSTGVVNLGASSPGSYTLTYTVPASGGCAVYTATYNLVIIGSPTASISYAGSPFCPNTGTASVTRTGTAGGVYSSTTGLSLNATTGDINTATSTPGSYTVTYTIAAAGSCAAFTASTNVVINSIGVWTGAVDNLWSVAGNWQCNTIPTSTTNVLIPTAVPRYPLINSTTTGMANNITIQSGATVTITDGVLQVRGAVTAPGASVIATSGKVEFNGLAAQSVSANLFYLNTLQDLVISNPAGVALTRPLRITGSLAFGNVNNSVFTTGDSLTLASVPANDAVVRDITNGGINSGNKINGLVTVERYMAPKRAYRFLTAPVNSVGSIKTNWMENVINPDRYHQINPNPGYGTNITGAGDVTNGFDPTQTHNPSMFTFNNQTQAYIPIPNTSGLFKAGNGYRIIVRGDRTIDMNSNTPPPTPTTLRAKGTIVTGSVTMAKPGAPSTANTPALSATLGAYNFVANPYPSVVNWLTVQKTDLAGSVYVFDPTIEGSNGRGAYISYNCDMGINSNDCSGVDNYLQSGQAFFVQTTGPNPSLTFAEKDKATLHRSVFRTANTLPHLSVQLLLPEQENTGQSADGLKVFFGGDFSNSVGSEDSYKFANLDENLAILRDETALSIEGRKPVVASDSIPLKIWQLTQKNYILKVNLQNFDVQTEAYLQDKYLQVTSSINASGETKIPFSLTNDAASSAPDRFKIVFETFSTLPLHLLGVKAVEKNNGVEVGWTAESENNMDRYEIEKSSDGNTFVTVGAVKAKADPGPSSLYSWFDLVPFEGDNFYRIKSFDKAGGIKYSNVTNVKVSKRLSGITVFPNPVQGKVLALSFKNIEKGTYVVTLISSLGDKIYTGTIYHNRGSANHMVELNTALPTGVYKLHITSNGEAEDISVLAQ